MPVKALEPYNKKRNFKITTEPKGGRKPGRGGLSFVIQKHAASHLHYDFRLEAGGVLKSWAVPKGPSSDPKVKRLAMQTEDHPLSYGSFEGVIPAGQYGGGNVIVWDRGAYRNTTTHHGKEIPLAEGLKNGHATFWLDGEKLKGGYSLIRTGRPNERNAWLLVKMNDAEAHPDKDPVAEKTKSVVSGRDVEELSVAGMPAWTDEGKLRHPRFIGLREDKKAVNVLRERKIPFKETAAANPRAVSPKNKTAGELEIDGKKVALSHLDKVFYPAAGFTKGNVLDYYIQAAPVMLPYLKGRPLTMKRYPNGVEGGFFYEKRAPSYRPSWLDTYAVKDPKTGQVTEYAVIQDMASLVWLANLACLEFHALLAQAPKVDSPTMVVFDLDPGPGQTILDCTAVAFHMRKLLQSLKLRAFPKTSGSKGLHLYIPLNIPTTYDFTTPFAHSLASLLERQHPERVISNMRKELRAGKIFVDWSQNSRHKTTVAPYSLRALPSPTVSTPLTWDELERAAAKKDVSALQFSPAQVLARIQKEGDLFQSVRTLRQKLPSLTSFVSDTKASKTQQRQKRQRAA